MLSTYAMFKNELNIQFLSRGKVKQVYSCAILIWDLIFGKANRAYPSVDWTSAVCTSLASSVESCTLTTSILDHSIDHFQAQLHHVPWTFLQFLLCVVAQKMLKALFVLISICIHAHQERGPHLRNLPCMVFDKNDKVPGNLGKLSLYVIFSGFWFLLYF